MANKKIETGTGGFEVDGKVVTYDVGVERDELDDGNWNSGDINVDKQSRDLSKITKVTLANYLHKTTLGKTKSVPQQAAETGNRFSIEPPTEFNLELQEFSTTSPQGMPVGPQPVPTSAFNANIGPLGENAQNGVRNNLPRPKWFTETGVIKGMNRQKIPTILDGNDLLRTAVNDDQSRLKENHPVKTYSSALLKNRWTSDTAYDANFLTTDPSTLEEIDRPIGALKYPLGKSYTPEYYETKKETKNLFGIGERLLTPRQLANVGPVLMARASGEVFFSDSNFDPQNLAYELSAATIPGSAQLGASRVEEIKLRALDVLQNLKLDADGINDGSITSIAPGVTSGNTLTGIGANILNSWGALNNPYDKFSGLGAVGMQVLAIALITAVTLIPSILLQAIDFGGPPAGIGAGGIGLKYTATDAIGRYFYGTYRGGLSYGGTFNIASLTAGQFSWKEILGFSHTTYPLERCLTVGTLAFFNISITDRFPDKSLEAFGASIKEAITQQNPEAYVIFARSIFRSFIQLGDRLIKLTTSAQSSIAGFFEQLLGFIEFVRESNIMQSLNTFASLGDKLLTLPTGIIDLASQGKGVRMSSIDASRFDSQDAVKKSRLITADMLQENSAYNGALHLAWSTFRSPDLLSLPASLKANGEQDELGRPAIMPRIDVDDRTGIRKLDIELEHGIYAALKDKEVRIPDTTREFFEKQLDAEYVPFYFHDVRTNEIVSFHAFLISLGDSYSATYDSTDAIGRVESIKTYKSTSRKIDVSFQVAALSEEDFDYMWLKLNKLSTMVYPQFSQGRFAEDSNFRITIPFSQQIAASPMIRMRIGDLIQSNYSRFNLARLFGYGYDGNILKSNTDDEKVKSQERLKALQKIQKQSAEDYNKKYKEAYAFKQSESLAGNESNVEIVPPPPSPAGKGKNTTKQPSPTRSKSKTAPIYECDPNTFVQVYSWGEIGLKDILQSPSIKFPTPYLALVPYRSVGGAFVECLVVTNNERIGITEEEISSNLSGKAVDEKQVTEAFKLYRNVVLDYTPDPTNRTGRPAKGAKIPKGTDIVPEDAKILGLKVLVLKHHLKPTPATAQRLRSEIKDSELKSKTGLSPEEKIELEGLKKSAKYSAAAKDFMKPENNAFVKSFESSGGRGLPGFIESLSFDWYTGTTWETERAIGKAPKMCKVTISFSPFHDITPGLDHEGANRAPLYPIGPHRKKIL